MSKSLVIAHVGADSGLGRLEKTIWASTKMGNNVDAIVMGSAFENAHGLLQKCGVQKVIALHGEMPLTFPEVLVEPLLQMIRIGHYEAIFAPGAPFEQNLLPVLAMKSGVGMLSDILGVKKESGEYQFARGILGGNITEWVQLNKKPYFCTVRTSMFSLPVESVPTDAPIEIIDIRQNEAALQKTLLSFVPEQNERPNVADSKIVVAGGRGIGGEENFRILEQFADVLGAAVGGSRAAVDAGWITNDAQVGQTGKIIAPRLYLAFGISGAIQHVAGVRNAQTVIAVNKDPDAPIFRHADVGICADVNAVLPVLIEKLQKN